MSRGLGDVYKRQVANTESSPESMLSKASGVDGAARQTALGAFLQEYGYVDGPWGGVGPSV